MPSPSLLESEALHTRPLWRGFGNRIRTNWRSWSWSWSLYLRPYASHASHFTRRDQHGHGTMVAGARARVCVCGVSRSKGEEGSSLLLGIFGGDQWVVGRVFSLLGLPFGGYLLEE
jgi:hypothetical protein